jgi:hypothetical protein
MKWLLPFVFLAGCVSQETATVEPGDPIGGSGVGGGPTGSGDPFAAPPTCTSGSTWHGGTGSSMAPGEPCLECHGSNKEPFFFAGTLYPTAHEPNDCSAPASVAGAQVIVVDSTGKMFAATVNTSGNFYYRKSGSFTPPFSAKVVMNGRPDREMIEHQTDGNCNGCHTQTGANGAPGRIVAP